MTSGRARQRRSSGRRGLRGAERGGDLHGRRGVLSGLGRCLRRVGDAEQLGGEHHAAGGDDGERSRGDPGGTQGTVTTGCVVADGHGVLPMGECGSPHFGGTLGSAVGRESEVGPKEQRRRPYRGARALKARRPTGLNGPGGRRKQTPQDWGATHPAAGAVETAAVSTRCIRTTWRQGVAVAAGGFFMISISLLGPTEVTVDGRRIPSSALAGRQRKILQILALESASAVPKDRLADLLWDGEPPASYVGTLESYVCVLRRTLGLASGRTSLLATTAKGYVLDAHAVRVDVREFRKLVAGAASGSAIDVVTATTAALQLVRGELLAEEPYAAWAVRERDDFTRTLVAACAHAAQLANAIGHLEEAELLARRAVEADPLCEEGWQQLMRVLWLTDRQCDALRAYAELRQALLDDLGEEPGMQSQQLYLAILRDTPTASANRATDEVGELRTLMLLLRQVLDVLPGVGAPPSDAALTTVAARVCSQAV